MNKILLLLVVDIVIFLFMNNQTCVSENFNNKIGFATSSIKVDIS
jgi:hypothetical protein